MISTITIVDVNNIDFEKNCVIDESLISKETFDSNNDILLFENRKTGEQRKNNLMNVSLYDDFVILNNQKYVILNMYSR